MIPRKSPEARLVLLTALATLLGMALPGLAGGGFGSQVALGDADMEPLTKSATLALSVNEQDFGQPNVVLDNCILLDTASTAAAGAQNKDLRLTPCMGKAAGTQITDADATERAATFAQVTGESTRYADLNSNSKLDKGEYVYLTTGSGAIVASTATGTWTVRLTAVGNYSAGTFVLAGDSDYAQYQSQTTALTSSIVERDDGVWYLVNVAAADTNLLKYSTVPDKSIRLMAQQSPKIEGTKIETHPGELVAGRAFHLYLDVKNNGKVGGVSLVSTKIAGTLVDARGSPYLAVGETARLAMTLVSLDAGTLAVEAGGFKANLTFAADPIDAKLKTLESKIATAGAVARGPDVADPGARSTSGQGFSMLGVGFTIVGVLVVGALILRARKG